MGSQNSRTPQDERLLEHDAASLTWVIELTRELINLNDKAEGIILMSIDDIASREIQDCASAYEMWHRLKELRSKCEQWYGLSASCELDAAVKGSDEKAYKYLERITTLAQTVQSAGFELTDTKFVMHIIKSLPTENEYFKRSTDLQAQPLDLGLFKR